MKLKVNPKKISFNKLMENKSFVKVLSVVIAVLLWGMVVYSLYPENSKEIVDVPVIINTQDDRIKQLGLNVISGGEAKVSVVVSAKRYVLDSITADDISVTASLNGVTSPGETQLELNADIKPTSTKEFRIEKVVPKTISVRFGRLITKTFPVEVDVSGITIPDGYTMNSAIPNPLEITISGSEEDVAQVNRVAVSINDEKELMTTETFTSQRIMMYNSEGKPIENEHLKLDKDTADVKIPVLKKKELPLKIEFLNVPTGFPTNKLEYTISKESVVVAGPEGQIDNYNELVVGYVDLKTLSIGSNYTFDIELPAEFVNVDNIQAVSVDFNTSDMSATRFYVSNISVSNSPADYNVDVSTLFPAI